ncbi:MAG: immunity 22 family protein [Flavobacteriaceae bacterium]|nr:immunity 22 family protein [Flavobacteriaceae bacterium]
MEIQNKVSIWLGNKNSNDSLKKYMEEVYTEDGDINSDFMSSFEIDYIDNQFQEVLFCGSGNSKNEIFEDFSYKESYIDKLPNLNWESFNSVICLYNFKYTGEIENADDFKFIGTFDFVDE